MTAVKPDPTIANVHSYAGAVKRFMISPVTYPVKALNKKRR